MQTTLTRTLIPMPELQSPEDRANPFSIYERLRQTTPVRYDETRGCWDIFRYEDVHRILKDPATFSSKRSLERGNTVTILTMDPPRHSQMRALVNKAFTPKMVNDLAPRIESITSELLAAVQGKGQMDMVHDLATPLPVIIIAELLGVPAEDRQLFKEWSDALVKGSADSSAEAFERVMMEKDKATKELGAYFAKIIGQRRSQPKDDLISVLLSAEIEGEKLSDEEILGFSILLLAAGNETTTNLITNSVRRLTEDLALQQQLRNDPTQIKNFIEEALRFYPPIQAVSRIATEDIQIGGKQIMAGEQVVNWVASANRDEAQFTDPNTFIIDRKPNNHLSFGFGIHFCLGAPLARLEGLHAIRAILERLQDIQLAPEANLEFIESPFVYGVKAFPITFKA
ncbi:cytochrome P450 [Ammoniphilus oxalaticus]|uniref:Cytochrome P450 n=1 Tax=Ammoniphilus oxalaticus TaxID=66863 RepID=A0A419SH83_9BACL|nr:cytochrome P450 [Ammoniphilus oxalaticus]RKD23136.1 cytochrome P450 [Ammoniphilus oxalaticus]